MAWKLFRANRKRLESTDPTLTMSSCRHGKNIVANQFRFNVKAVEKFSLGQFQYIQLRFDPDRQAIGVEPLTTYQSGAAKLTREKNCRGAIFTGTKFARQFGIDFEGNREVTQEGKLLVIRL